MALSDQLTKLAARAKAAEEHAAAAKAQAKSDLEQQVKDARTSAEAHADALHEKTQNAKGEISARWDEMGREWKRQIASIRREVDKGRAEHDVKHAQHKAERADEDAAIAIDFAYAALEEADYAVLDAYLAHKEADELAQAVSPS
jgi:hypothetical protein